MSSNQQLAKLIEHYQKALLINPHRDDIHYQLAELYYQQGDLEKTLETCRQALTRQSNTILILDTLTKVFMRLGFSENEIKYFSEVLPKMVVEEAIAALVLQPSNGKKTDNEVGTWKASTILGYTLVQQDLWNDAIQSCFTAITLEPSLNFPHFIIKYFVLPNINDLEPLASLYFQVIQLPKIHRLAYSVLGDILTKQRKLAQAIYAYKSAWLQANHQTPTKPKLDRQQTVVDYLVIGSGKAGTTSLFNYLSQHPQIINPHEKELLFFNERYEYGFDWYLAQFPPRSFKREKFLTGEASPWYLGTLGAEERVFSMFPLIKLIAIFRNPVTRAISHYFMNLRMGLEHRSLEEAITAEIAIIENKGSLELISDTYWKTERGYLWFSLYLPFLKKWMSRFPKEQFLILKSEELYHAPAETLSRVFTFLGVSDCDLISYSKLNLGSYQVVDHALQKTLFDFFYKHNQELEAYLGRKFGWNDL